MRLFFGGPAINGHKLCDGRPVGFASPAFAGFAFIGISNPKNSLKIYIKHLFAELQAIFETTSRQTISVLTKITAIYKTRPPPSGG